MVDYVPDCHYFHPPELRSSHRDGENGLSFGSVEANQHISVATEFPSPDLFETYLVYLPLQSVSLLAQRILIDSYQFLISQDLHGGI